MSSSSTEVDTPTPIPPLVAYAIAVITAVVALLVSQGLIDNHWEKLVSGGAAIIIPAAYVFANALAHAAHIKAVAGIKAARIAAQGPTAAGRR